MSLEAEVLVEPMQPEDWAHVNRVVDGISSLTKQKYQAGKEEHQGSCWLKPGMLAHATDEVADLGVYLFTLREQMLALVGRLRSGEVITPSAAADEIERWLVK